MGSQGTCLARLPCSVDRCESLMPTTKRGVNLTSAVHLQNGASLPSGLPSRCPPFWQVQPLVREHGYLPRLRAQYVLAGTKVDVGDLLAFARSLRVKGYVKPAGSPHFVRNRKVTMPRRQRRRLRIDVVTWVGEVVAGQVKVHGTAFLRL